MTFHHLSQNPKNLLTRFGTSLRSIIEYCGGMSDTANKVILGGPMMGIAQFDLTVPVIKATSGIVCTMDYKYVEPIACIGCGSCVKSCPMFLMPTRLARLSHIRHWSDADKMGIKPPLS